jgi:putative salt-induced outer membrane protein YdiY
MLAGKPVLGRKSTDVIVMRNGDRITCEVKGLSSNTLYISVDYILNTLSVDWTKVDHIESKQLLLVRTQSGLIYRGTLSTPKTPEGRPIEIEVAETPKNKVAVEKQQIANLDQTSPSFWQRWNGSLGSGFSYTKGNESSQYNLNSNIGYLEDRWSAGLTYNSNLTANTGASTSTRNQLALSGERFMLWNNWYYTGVVSFLQSSVQGIQLQDTFGGGIGRNLINRGSAFLTVYGGFAWQQINYEEAVVQAPKQHVTAALIGTQLKLFRFNKTTLALSGNILPALSELGRVQYTLNTTYYVKLWGELNWNLTFYGNWDTRPPPGFVKSDYGATSGLSVTLGTPIRP